MNLAQPALGAIAWDPNTGFALNGVPTKILGTANHQEPLGCAKTPHVAT